MKRLLPQNPPHLRSPLLRLGAGVAWPFYAAAVTVRNLAYDLSLLPIHRAHVPVISVGNLTTGGTGKTPMVVEIVRILRTQSATPAVILRGYRGTRTEGGSDEARLLAESLPDTTIVADPDRAAAARRVAVENPGVNVIVLDDGFQHRRLHRDLDLVLIDATNPFGYGHVLPRGLMREIPSGLCRAAGIIVTRSDQIDSTELGDLDRRITKYHGKPPLAHAAHRWSSIVDDHDNAVETGRDRVWVIAGIGNPHPFLDQAATRFQLIGNTILRDHVVYSRAILDDLRRRVTLNKPHAVLTTEKDWVKLRALLQSSPLPVPVWRPKLKIEFLDGLEPLTRLLTGALKPR